MTPLIDDLCPIVGAVTASTCLSADEAFQKISDLPNVRCCYGKRMDARHAEEAVRNSFVGLMALDDRNLSLDELKKRMPGYFSTSLFSFSHIII